MDRNIKLALCCVALALLGLFYLHINDIVTQASTLGMLNDVHNLLLAFMAAMACGAILYFLSWVVRANCEEYWNTAPFGKFIKKIMLYIDDSLGITWGGK